MERTVLFCDNHPLKNAVQRLELSNGRATKGGALRLDACHACAKAAYRIFTPRKQDEPRPEYDFSKGKRLGQKTKPKRKRSLYKRDYSKVKAQIMKIAPVGNSFTGAHLIRTLKLQKYVVLTAIKMLVAEKKLISTGIGAGRLLTVA